MSDTGDAQAAGGLTDDQATDAFRSVLAREDGDPPAGDRDGKQTQGDDPLDGDDEPEAEPEDEGDDAPEDDGEEQSDEDEDADDSDEQPQAYTVKVDGKEVEVTLPELLKGYSREQDYSRKTMALAENVKAFEADKATISGEREQYKAVLDAWAEQLKAVQEPTDDLEALRRDDPAEYAARIADAQLRKDHMASIEAERNRVAEQEKQDQAKQAMARIHEEAAKMFEAIPEWKDDAKAKADRAKMRDYGKSIGFSDDDVAGISDHRMMVALRDAARWKALQAKKPQVQAQAEAVKTARPGSSASRPTRATEMVRARERLAKTGSDTDALAVFRKLI